MRTKTQNNREEIIKLHGELKLLKKDISVLRDNHIYNLSLRVGRTEKVLWSCTLIAITHLIFALLQ